MKAYGSIDEVNTGLGKLHKGTALPEVDDLTDGELFSLKDPVTGNESLYILKNKTWLKVLLDGDELEAGNY